MKNGCEEFAYVEHLIAEHRRLDHLISRTLASLPTWEESDLTAWKPRMVQGLRSIRAELAQHFREEEEGGCLEEAVARCPPLSTSVREVEAEHHELLQAIDDLIGRSQQVSGSAAAEAQRIVQDLHRVVQKLRAHEVQENRIMQRGFAVSLEDEDMAEERVGEYSI